jgi:F0F1-type ATP synthase membrane subunit c/vacuolar-type H+-ATPase subunit K
MHSQDAQARAGVRNRLVAAGCAALAVFLAGLLPAYGQSYSNGSAVSAAALHSEIAQASVFIDTVFREEREDQYPIASELYLGMLSLWGQDMPAADHTLVNR